MKKLYVHDLVLDMVLEIGWTQKWFGHSIFNSCNLNRDKKGIWIIISS